MSPHPHPRGRAFTCAANGEPLAPQVQDDVVAWLKGLGFQKVERPNDPVDMSRLRDVRVMKNTCIATVLALLVGGMVALSIYWSSVAQSGNGGSSAFFVGP